MNLTPAQITKFNRILDLEDAVRIDKAVSLFTKAGTPTHVRSRQQDSLESDQGKLFQAIAELTTEETQAFSEYRITARQ